MSSSKFPQQERTKVKVGHILTPQSLTASFYVQCHPQRKKEKEDISVVKNT